jgi:hypothetical protein
VAFTKPLTSLPPEVMMCLLAHCILTAIVMTSTFSAFQTFYYAKTLCE